ncbi:uncharacterized protein LOC128758757 isoform X2 [Synchiropus splendidus]|uniref:uncharacterized protein LOC128758757 isoform X2 n=1 Tax=Synchiropus splendidus TaxID=270530 RepID=UPI00237E92CD|nr:uncharacterized protein LOC128758757 isoform X2 [Synchiropus splendidus]
MVQLDQPSKHPTKSSTQDSSVPLTTFQMARTKQVPRRGGKNKVPDKQRASPPVTRNASIKTRSQRRARTLTGVGKAPRKWKATKTGTKAAKKSAKKTAPNVNTPPDADPKTSAEQASREVLSATVPKESVATTSGQENQFVLPDVSEIQLYLQAWLLADESSLLLQEAAGTQVPTLFSVTNHCLSMKPTI